MAFDVKGSVKRKLNQARAVLVREREMVALNFQTLPAMGNLVRSREEVRKMLLMWWEMMAGRPSPQHFLALLLFLSLCHWSSAVRELLPITFCGLALLVIIPQLVLLYLGLGAALLGRTWHWGDRALFQFDRINTETARWLITGLRFGPMLLLVVRYL